MGGLTIETNWILVLKIYVENKPTFSTQVYILLQVTIVIIEY